MRFLALFIPFLLIAKILSPLQESLLNFDKQKAVISGDKLKDSWINPITLQYKYNRSNQTGEIQTINQFIISINQPIFISGAIFLFKIIKLSFASSSNGFSFNTFLNILFAFFLFPCHI